MMTDTFLTVSQQAALQQALLDAKFVKKAENVAAEVHTSPQHQAFSQVAVELYKLSVKGRRF